MQAWLPASGRLSRGGGVERALCCGLQRGQLGRGLGPGYARHYHVLWDPASHLQGKGWRLRTVRPVVLAHQGQVQVVGGGGARWQPGIPGPPHRVLCGNPESAMDVPHPSVNVLLNSGPEAVPSATPHLGCEPC